MNIIGKEVLTKIAGPKRSSLWNAARHNSRRPPRYLGRTKTQLLDVCMKSSVVVCAFISVLILPVGGSAIYNFWKRSKINPHQIEEEKPDLLSEGRYNKA